jgi:3-oxoacyl-(acyl-carrier-protein) synthase
MKIDLAVIGQGAVSPAGVGVDALLHREPVPTSVAALGQPDKPWPVLRIDLKDPAFDRWQGEPRLRRASSMTFFLVEAAEQALAGVSPDDRAQTGIIVAFSAGCVAYSRRFFEGIVTQHSASPALFPETVFNSPVSHVASVLRLNGAAYALVGDETAWVAALQTASVWLQQERVKQVLVMGAEEFDPIVLDAYRSARWLRRRQNSAHGFLTSEGAAGILVRRAGPGDAWRITSARDGLIYRTRKEAAVAAGCLLRESDPVLPCFQSARHNWLAALEQKAVEDRPAVPTDGQPYLGEAFTASAAWHTLRALARLNDFPRILLPVWGLNYQFGVLELDKGFR